MAEITRIHADEEADRAGTIRRVLSFVGSAAEGIVPRRNDELTIDQRSRFSRYVGNMALVAGNYYDDSSMQEAMDRAAATMHDEGMLKPERPLGLRVLWSRKEADSEKNQRLLYGSEVLRETLLKDYNISAYISPRAEYPYEASNSPEPMRALEALNRSARGFETLLGFGREKRYPRAGEVGFIAMLDSQWAGRAFKGVNIQQLRHEDGIAVLNGAGYHASEVRWVSPSIRDSLMESHD